SFREGGGLRGTVPAARSRRAHTPRERGPHHTAAAVKMAPKPGGARLISSPSVPPRSLFIAGQRSGAAESMRADPAVLLHEKLMLRSAVEDLGTPLERLADKIKGDPFDDMALWFALRAAFVITSHTSPNPIIERIRQDLVKERAARARQGRELGSKKID